MYFAQFSAIRLSSCLNLLSYATEIKETKRVMVLYAYYEDFSLGPGLRTTIAFKATLPGLSQK